MIFLLYALGLVVLAGLPTLLVARNLPLFQKAPQGSPGDDNPTAISVLIPARNEEAGIERTIRCVLDSQGIPFEIIVLDDHSTDGTAKVVKELAQTDERVRLEPSAPLPEGWNGKQHACWQLAQLARFDWLLFLDADVHLSRDALRRLGAEFQRSGTDLLSGFPRQITGSWSEHLWIPMMHFLLLGYLPLDQMRRRRDPALGAGCGQLFLAERSAYFQADGHRAIRQSRHDGLKLPRSYRAAGLDTDLFDASDMADVRMYRGCRAVVQGLLKNATEGIANAKLIGLFTVLLLGGSVLPIFSFAHAVFYGWPAIDRARLWATLLLGLATFLSFLPRWMLAKRFGQPRLGVWLHPLAVGGFVGMQWWAFGRQALGRKAVAWRGRQ